MKRFVLILCSLLIVLSASAEIKYIFYFIGDGMGTNQVLSAEMYRSAIQGNPLGRVQTLMTTFPYSGHASTYSKSNGITDSAAAGTCLATGSKTNNGTLGLDADGNRLTTIAEDLKAQGWGIGIMTTVAIDHATPAAFYAHVKERNEYYKIGKQLCASGFDFFGGAGFHHPQGKHDNKSTNLYRLAEQNGYTIVRSFDEAQQFLNPKSEEIVPPAGKEILNAIPIRLSVSGLLGGHSGDDINKGRANANQILVWFLARIMPQTDLQLASINGGNLRNAIAREAEAVIAIPMAFKEQIRIEWNHFVAQMEQVFGAVETDMRLDLETTDMPETFIPADKAYRLIMALCECPHGMIAMSHDIPGLVETSTNLASIKMKQESTMYGRSYIEVNTSQRSSKESSKHHLKWVVEQALSMACDEVTHGDGYPGWTPNPSSPLLDITKKAYIDLFKSEPKVLAIHAGLECGLFLEKYPYLDMVSIGPQMYGVHSPQERLSIPSTDRCYSWLCQILKTM